MIEVDPGHVYELDTYDATVDGATETLVFVKRCDPPEKYPGNENAHPGTNLQEVLRACVARVKYLNQQIPDSSNALVLDALRRAIFYLEVRAARRHRRSTDTLGLVKIDEHAYVTARVEDAPTCRTCGHLHQDLVCE